MIQMQNNDFTDCILESFPLFLFPVHSIYSRVKNILNLYLVWDTVFIQYWTKTIEPLDVPICTFYVIKNTL